MKKRVFQVAILVALFAATSIFTVGCGNSEPTREDKIEEIITKIKETPDWLAGIKADAETKKQPLDTLIRQAAVYVVDTDLNKAKPREQRLKEMVETINKTPDWIAGIKKDAEAKKEPLDSLVMKAANWMIDDQDGKHPK